MAKNYYLILGVPFDAASDEIRSAFRRLALRYHPDRQRESSPGTFQDISEAYGVLSDPVRRAHHDRELRRCDEPREVVPVPPGARDPEPLVSEPVPIEGQPEFARPSYDALFDRLMRNFADLDGPKSERAEPLDFELILSSEEAEHGILVPFQVPVFSTCRRCGGLGGSGPFPCDDCDGEGRRIIYDTIRVRVPGGVRDGTVIEASLEELGVHNLWLRVHVRLERH